MKAFYYKNDLYIRVIPGKKLFQSTMVHEVVNRGDIFAVRASDSLLTIIPGNTVVEQIEMELGIPA
jgi:tyrosine-protein phosphatase YwqE